MTAQTKKFKESLQVDGSVEVLGKTGATAVPPIFAGGTTSGAPTTGAHVVGEVVISRDDARLYVCTVAGTPGTWVTLTTSALNAALTILGGVEVVQTHGNTGATETINLVNGNYHIVTQEQACVYTFAGVSALSGSACSFTLQFTATPVGATTWPASVKWPDGLAPTLTGVSIVSFVTTDGGTTWYGFPGGKAFA